MHNFSKIFIDRLKNITVFQLLLILFFAFVLYSIVDVFIKVQTHRNYDMEKLLADIQKRYPKSELTFQNIRIEDNYLKRHAYSTNNSYDDTYYETTYFYISNNQLKKEPSFLWVMYLFPSFLCLAIFHEDPRTLKIRKLNKVSTRTWFLVIGSFFISLFIVVSSIDKYERKFLHHNTFKSETDAIVNQADLSNYKK